MDLTVLVEKLTTAQASVQVKDGELTAANAKVTQLNETVTNLSAEIATLKTNADATKVTALTTEVTSLKASNDAAMSYVRAEAKRLAVAASLPVPADEATLEALTASIETSRTKLRETFTQGVVTPNPGAVAASDDGYTASFKTR